MAHAAAKKLVLAASSHRTTLSTASCATKIGPDFCTNLSLSERRQFLPVHAERKGRDDLTAES